MRWNQTITYILVQGCSAIKTTRNLDHFLIKTFLFGFQRHLAYFIVKACEIDIKTTVCLLRPLSEAQVWSYYKNCMLSGRNLDLKLQYEYSRWSVFVLIFPVEWFQGLNKSHHKDMFAAFQISCVKAHSCNSVLVFWLTTASSVCCTIDPLGCH